MILKIYDEEGKIRTEARDIPLQLRGVLVNQWIQWGMNYRIKTNWITDVDRNAMDIIIDEDLGRGERFYRRIEVRRTVLEAILHYTGIKKIWWGLPI